LHPAIVCIIPGGISPAEVRENAAGLSRPIPPELWRQLVADGLVRADAPIAA